MTAPTTATLLAALRRTRETDQKDRLAAALLAVKWVGFVGAALGSWAIFVAGAWAK